MLLEVYFDTICPWCLIGKKRLEEALFSRQHISLKIKWRPFLLNPNMPKNGVDRQTYLSQKFGGPERAHQVYHTIAKTGEQMGIGFKFNDIKRTANSIDSHRLILFADTFDQATPVVSALFDAFFLKGQDIGDKELLTEIGNSCGLNKNDVIRLLENDTYLAEVLHSNALARDIGIQGVPAYVAKERYVISGAQEPQTLGRFLDTAWNA